MPANRRNVRAWAALLAVVTASYGLAGMLGLRDAAPASADTLPLGTVSVITTNAGCSDVSGTATCTKVKLSCPGIEDLTTLYADHPATAPLRGMAVFLPGGSGTDWMSRLVSGGGTLISDLQAKGFEVIEVKYQTFAWYKAPSGVQTGFPALACRPATMVKYLHDTVFVPMGLPPAAPGTCGFCVAGNSGGAAQVAYALSRYGLGNIIDVALPIAGPTHAALTKGCISLPGATKYLYPQASAGGIDLAYGYSSNGPCYTHDPSFEPRWDADSNDGVGTFVYPNTRLHVILGAKDLGEVPYHARDYIAKVQASGGSITSETVPNTAHNTYETVEGRTAVENALTATPAPAPVLTATPPASSASSVSFGFTDAQTGVTFNCSLDQSPFTLCASPQAYGSLADGPHTFSVTAIDANGQPSIATTYSWTVNTAVAPAAPTFTSTPSNPSGPAASFTFTDGDPGATFGCSLDGSAYTACSSPQAYSALADGSHTFAVQATNGAGSSPATSYAWTVDATPPPTPSFTSTPADPSTSSVSFSFTDGDASATFSCSLDSAAFSACTSPQAYSGLALTSHSFSVRAADGVGNVSGAASFAWTVNRVTPPPAPTLTAIPTNPGGQSASFAFTDSDPGATFSCSLDGAVATACTSPSSYSGLSGGSHTFSVQAANSGGTSPSTSYTWTVDATPPPAPIITATPSDPGGPSATFTFSDGESGGTFSCSLDGASPGACASPVTYSGLTSGAHTFAVQAVDPVGNASNATSFGWTVAAPPPAPTFTSTPSASSGPSVSFSFTDSQSGVGFSCALDGASYTACSSPQAYGSLAGGSHTFSVEAVDSYGNVSAPATYSWSVDAVSPTVTMTRPAVDAVLTSASVGASWTGSDNVGITRYDIYQRVGTSGQQTLVQSSTALSYTRTGVIGQTYCYQVIAFDAAGNSGTAPERCQAVPWDDVSSQVTYSGTVSHVKSTSAYGGTLTMMDAAGAQAQFSFTGRLFAVLANRSPSSGILTVSLDGAVVANVDLYAASTQTRVIPYQLAVAPGLHTVTLSWSGTKNPSSTGTAISLDAVAAITQ